MTAYSVTLEYATVNFLVVAVEAPDIASAIAQAYTTEDWDRAETYDHPGETYVAHVAQWPTLDDAENAGTLDGTPLPIPFDDREDGQKLFALEKAVREVLAYDDALNNAEKVPTADDYNALFAIIRAAKA